MCWYTCEFSIVAAQQVHLAAGKNREKAWELILCKYLNVSSGGEKKEPLDSLAVVTKH